MDRNRKSPTLLVFTLGPECRRSTRQLLPAPLRQAETLLRRRGLDRALEAGRRAGLRIVVSSPGPLDLPADIEQSRQTGCRFADRLRDATQALLAELDGAPLIVVGSDAPDLTANHLRSALACLEKSPDDVVLGPAHDGGFYLLATRSTLDKELARVRWCRHDTRHSLEAALRDRKRVVHLLEPLRDLDRYADVEVWLAARSRGFGLGDLRRLLSRTLAQWRRPVVAGTANRPTLALATHLSGRGPPG